MRTIWRNDKYTFGIDFYGEGRARLVVFFLNRNRKKKSETLYFDLTDLPSGLTPESFLTFVRENEYEESEEVAQAELDRHAVL